LRDRHSDGDTDGDSHWYADPDTDGDSHSDADGDPDQNPYRYADPDADEDSHWYADGHRNDHADVSPYVLFERARWRPAILHRWYRQRRQRFDRL
jgi:hypothetical protein